MKNILIIFCLLSMGIQAVAQDKKKATNGEFWGKSEAYLHKQAFQMFGLIDEALTENPPTVGAPMVRKLALFNLDAMLHETKYDNTEPFNNFVDSRMQKLITELNKPVKKGMKIYKVYNDGFIAQTKSATIAFDIVRGGRLHQHVRIGSVSQGSFRNRCTHRIASIYYQYQQTSTSL